jgi:hypothetical protein
MWQQCAMKMERIGYFALALCAKDRARAFLRIRLLISESFV